MIQTEEFLGRKLAKHHKAIKGKGDSHAEPASAAAAATSASTAEDEEGQEVLGRPRRKEGAEPLDLEVIDDRDLYQHLLKVRTFYERKCCGNGRCLEGFAGKGGLMLDGTRRSGLRVVMMVQLAARYRVESFFEP